MDLSKAYPRAAKKLAYQRRVQLALAVSILCPEVEGPGAARLARWRDVDLLSGRWTIPLAHVYAGRRSRVGRARSICVTVPPDAVGLLKEARDLRDGMCLLLSLVRPVECSLEEARRKFKWPRRPRGPGQGSLVFSGRTSGEPIPEHAFRYMLKGMGVYLPPTYLVRTGGALR